MSRAFTIDTGTGAFTYEATYSGLTGPATLAHLHNAPVGTAGGVIVNLSGDFANDDDGMVTGSGMLTADQLNELNDGNVYLNIHTEMHPNGEIRGQLVEAP